ncbi:sodium/calcium exchanger regulatory protein 1-like [Homarus americanus]|uniref:Sodium/calcium exchanger regulatory protein 1-like 3 n=1 Tax=Homarus americanus TaxID=6706 RepID=A0A8J5TIH0_HOMAM|nr:sodium/calcium exchanger regulatory protein 1-like [Homarus americanus]KAG7175050.1 Sodium/calcium exchanger regulatory protein 1-like 3 [Homarus americanus]
MVQFNGTYKMEKNENLEALLEVMEVGMIMRKIALMTKPKVEVKVDDDDTWTIITHGLRRTVTWKFSLGEEKEFTSLDGNKFKASFTLEGDKLIRHNNGGNEAQLDFVREFTDYGIIQHITHRPTGTKCTRTFKRV